MGHHIGVDISPCKYTFITCVKINPNILYSLLLQFHNTQQQTLNNRYQLLHSSYLFLLNETNLFFVLIIMKTTTLSKTPNGDLKPLKKSAFACKIST